MKKLVVLGISGSIGKQTLNIIKANPDKFSLIAVSVNSNIDFLNKLIKEFPSIKYVAASKKVNYPNVISYDLKEGLNKLAILKEADIIVNAVSGYAGLEPTLAAINASKDIAIANKEALVCGGDLIWKALEVHPVSFMPIDSEHSAIYQCLVGEDKNTVKRLIITASGGPFKDKTLGEIKHVNKEEALHHPTWNMGAKITIDSATLINKGLEVIEAHYLFHLPYEKISTVMHYESIVHSMVEYIDGSIKAQMGVPSMEIPIQYALCKGRIHKDDQVLSFDKAFELHFKPIDMKRFKSIALAYKVGKMGGIMPCVYSVANEVAVKAFLEDRIKFYQIVDIVDELVNSVQNKEVDSLETIKETINDVYKLTNELILKKG